MINFQLRKVTKLKFPEGFRRHRAMVENVFLFIFFEALQCSFDSDSSHSSSEVVSPRVVDPHRRYRNVGTERRDRVMVRRCVHGQRCSSSLRRLVKPRQYNV